MTLHGVLLTLAATLATLYGGWWVAERNNDGVWLGWTLAGLVFLGGLSWDAGW